MFNGNKIDRLVKLEERLNVRMQKVDDRRKYKNSQIENTIQYLENRAFIIKKNADNMIAEIKRRLKKTRDQIKLEKDYYNSIGNVFEKNNKEE